MTINVDDQDGNVLPAAAPAAAPRPGADMPTWKIWAWLLGISVTITTIVMIGQAANESAEQDCWDSYVSDGGPGVVTYDQYDDTCY